MSTLPTRANIAGTPDNATAKAALASIYDFVAQRLAAGTSGAGTATAAELLSARDSLQIAPAQMANPWINSDFGINQRGLASVADGAYAFDRTYVLTETGSLTVGQLSQPTDGIPFAMRLTQPDVTAKRMGFAQVVESRNCLAYRGGNLVFAPKLRSSASGNLRVALLAHTGTADTVTRDVINTWSSTTYTPGGFFIGTNLSVIATGATAVTANTWTDVAVSSTSSGGVVAPSTMNNLILVAWTESTQAQNATLDASVMRAGPGSQIPIWTPPDAQQELARCQRYYQIIGFTEWYGSTNFNGTNGNFMSALPVTMRATPTLVAYVIGGITSSRGAGYWNSAPSATLDASSVNAVSLNVAITVARTAGICCMLDGASFAFGAEL